MLEGCAVIMSAREGQGKTHDDPTGSDLKKEGGEISGTFKETVR